MKTVFRIFKSDIRAIVTHFFAFCIAVAISVLPALYAWVNIYANANPYVNTGNINIAVASNDPGLTLDNGQYVNSTEEIFDTLRGSTSIGWQFSDDPDEAIEGVRSGKYYAAIIFEENFTYNMYHFEQALVGDEAPLTYYQNDKKNAIAPKITETAAETLLETINQKYLETVFKTFFDNVNDLSDTLQDGDAVDSIVNQLADMRDSLWNYSAAIDVFLANSKDTETVLINTQSAINNRRATARRNLSNAEKNLVAAKKTIQTLSDSIDSNIADIDKTISDINELITQVRDEYDSLTDEERQKLEDDVIAKTDTLITKLQNLRALIPDSGDITGSKAVADTLDVMIDRAEHLQELVKGLPEQVQAAEDALDLISSLKVSDLVPAFKLMISGFGSTIESLTPLLDTVFNMVDDIYPVMNAGSDTVISLNKSLSQLQKLLDSTANRLNDIIEAVRNAEEDDRVQLLIDMLGGDPEMYSRFFTDLVDVNVEEVYSVASYGAAMSPFYSVLAIWVGGVILVSILKTNVDRRKFPEAREAERFFGRFIMFFLLGQIQAAVIVAGDIFLLGCAPVHPWLMWIAAAVTSFVFVMLIYALTLSFGDVGKAIVVVIMVLQIAGSSGSYPIEILPEIFSKIYRFFPFPYAINAMREALCGTYRNDFLIYLAELMIFGVLGIVIGLLVRKPFIGMNHFVSEKVEETEVL